MTKAYRETAHASQLGLDRLLAGETRGTRALRAHLSQCRQCRQRYEALAAEQGARMTDVHVSARVDALVSALEDAPMAAQRPRRRAPTDALRRWLARWQWWTPIAAAAAVALLALWPRDHTTMTRAPDPKNAPVFQILELGPDGDAHLLAADAPLASGAILVPVDAPLASGAILGFRAACVHRCAMLLAGLDEAGHAAMVEHAVPAPWLLTPEQWNQLPVRIELRAPLRLAALFCEQAPARERFLGWLEQHPPGPEQRRELTAPTERPASPASPELSELGAGCVMRSVLLQPR